MINMQDFLNETHLFNKFQIDDLLFVEIVCPVETDTSERIWWWHNNFFCYTLAGSMALKTLHGEYLLKAGDCVFAKKGSVVSSYHLTQEDFCELRIFVSDAFIKTVFQKYKLPAAWNGDDQTDTIIPLPANEVLEVYFHSLLTYFRQQSPPAESLLKIKFEELLVNIISNNIHKPLTNFFSKLCVSNRPSIKEIMESNFFNNLSMTEFSRLCGRSLSAFKQEFKSIFQVTPGKWLLEKRLDYSRYLLETTRMSIEEICMQSGFENRSHFNRVFKTKYHITPHKLSLQSNKIYA